MNTSDTLISKKSRSAQLPTGKLADRTALSGLTDKKRSVDIDEKLKTKSTNQAKGRGILGDDDLTDERLIKQDP